jgi:hypothetical protein
MFAVLMILGVLISARLNDTEINYEETKRLIGIIAAAFNFIFFSNYFNKVIKSEEDRISAILFSSFAFVFTTYFWYSVKIVGDGNSYPWLKFYGALPVAFFLVQMSRHPLFSKIKAMRFLLIFQVTIHLLFSKPVVVYSILFLVK